MIRTRTALLPLLIGLCVAAGVLSADAPSAGAHHGEGWYRVVRLIDGDTVDVAVAGGTERVRLFGVDAPELGTNCGPPATAALRRLLTDNGRDFWVWLELGPRSADRFDRALYYLWVQDGSTWYLLDEWLAWFGYAHAWTGDGQYRNQIIAAERDAQANRRGCLWA